MAVSDKQKTVSGCSPEDGFELNSAGGLIRFCP